MKKRLISMLLALSLCLGLSVPASATNTYEEENISTTMDSEGNQMTFTIEPVADGTYVMKYYLNGQLQIEYELDGSQYIEATPVNGESYTLDTSDFIQFESETLVETPTPYSVREAFCSITYKKSTNPNLPNWLGATAYAISTAKKDTYTINAYKDSVYSDLVATTASYIIGVVMALVSPAGGPATVIAESLLGSAIASVGGQVINNLISIPFNKKYDCYTATYDWELYLTHGRETLGTGSLKNGGIAQYIYFENATQGEQQLTGYTPTSIARLYEAEFARAVWSACTTKYSYPGYSSYNYI